MRIVVVHNHYQFQGGEDESFRAEVAALRDVGHHVTVLTEHNDRVQELGPLRVAGRTVWSMESYGRIRRLLRDERPDLLHVQNFFPLLSPSVYYAAHAEHVPVVQSLRNYRLLCANSLFFRDGHVCEDCLGRAVVWPGVVHKCYRDSATASATVATMIGAHRLMGTWNTMVDGYIVLTEFARNKFIQGGLPADKLLVKPNFVYPDPGEGVHDGEYALFVGRLTPEKGVYTLLDAWSRLPTTTQLRIIGDGPLREHVMQVAAERRNIHYVGHLPVTEVYNQMGAATLVILPSEWYETFGRVAVEAFAVGTPVIASRIGAVAELVEDGVTGLVFEPGNAADLAAKIGWLLDHPEVACRMRKEARAVYEEKYTAEKNVRMLIDIYTKVIARSTAKS